MDWNLKTWQVKTICPVSPSAGEGAGTGVLSAEEEVGFGAGRSKAGVAPGWVPAGDEDEEGVEACSVANRSGVGETAMGLLQARMKKIIEIAKKSLRLSIQFNRLQMKFFPR